MSFPARVEIMTCPKKLKAFVLHNTQKHGASAQELSTKAAREPLGRCSRRRLESSPCDATPRRCTGHLWPAGVPSAASTAECRPA